MKNTVDVIRVLIKEKGMTLKAVAEKSGLVTFEALSQSLCGKRRLMGVELIGLCQVLDLNIKDFRD